MAKISKRLRTMAGEGGDLFFVVRGSEEAEVVVALNSVTDGEEEEESELSPNLVSVTGLPDGQVCVLVDLKGEADLHRDLLERLAATLGSAVRLDTAAGGIYDVVTDTEPARVEAHIYAQEAVEPLRLGVVHPVPASWMATVAQWLEAWSDTGRVLCSESSRTVLVSDGSGALRWLERRRSVNGDDFGAGLSAVREDTLVTWRGWSDMATLEFLGPVAPRDADKSTVELIESLYPAPLSATVRYNGGSAGDLHWPTDRGPTEIGPHAAGAFLQLGSTQLLADGVWDDPTLRTALDDAGVDYHLEGRWLMLGTAADWMDDDTRHEYQRLSEFQLRPWKALGPTSALSRTVYWHISNDGKELTLTALSSTDAVLPEVADWLRQAEDIPVADDNPDAEVQLIEVFAERLVLEAGFDMSTLPTASGQTKLAALRSSDGSLHLVLESHFWDGDFADSWDGTFPHALQLVESWATTLARAARRHRNEVGPTVWD